MVAKHSPSCDAIAASLSSSATPTPQRPAWSVTPDIPQSEIVATNFYDRAKFWAKNWAKNWAKFWTKFSCFIRCAERPTKISPQIPPNLSLHVLSRLLGLKSQNFISASFWGLGCPRSLMRTASALFPSCESAVSGRHSAIGCDSSKLWGDRL